MTSHEIPGFTYPYSKRGSEQKEHRLDLSPTVRVFVGPSVVSMIEGPEGYVLIDTGATEAAALTIKKQLDELTKKPLAGIILTHSHPDHTTGGSVMLKGAPEDTPVWGRSNFGAEAAGFAGLGKIAGKRGAFQFGAFVPFDMHTPNPMLSSPNDPANRPGQPLKPIAPNKMFAGESQSVNLGGVELELYAAPGESADQLFVWYGKERVLFCADNMYGSFPNLYPVRGSGYRDVFKWAESIKKMLPFKPVALITGHNDPELGEAACMERMTNHYEAIMHVYNETLKGMDAGLGPEELATSITLPEHLARQPYLAEYYGCVAWSVRSIFAGLLGWFDGNATNLVILSPKEEAERMAALAGGADKLLAQAQEALKNEDYRWTAKLADYCLRLNPDSREAKLAKADALLALSKIIMPISGINYLVSAALELKKQAG